MSRIAGFASAFAYGGFAVGDSAGVSTISDVALAVCTVSDAALAVATVSDAALATATVSDAEATP